MHFFVKKLDFDYIDDGIFVGTNQCCMAHFDQQLLQKELIEADLSLEENKVDHPFGIKYYLWLPVKDQDSPTTEQVRVGSEYLDILLALKKRVFVHCKNGHGRAPTFVVAYYMLKKRKSLREAVGLVTNKRSTTHFSDDQMNFLRGMANELNLNY